MGSRLRSPQPTGQSPSRPDEGSPGRCLPKAKQVSPSLEIDRSIRPRGGRPNTIDKGQNPNSIHHQNVFREADSCVITLLPRRSR